MMLKLATGFFTIFSIACGFLGGPDSQSDIHKLGRALFIISSIGVLLICKAMDEESPVKNPPDEVPQAPADDAKD